MSVQDTAKSELLDKLKKISEENDNEPLHSSFVRWVCEKYLDITNDDDVQDIISVGGKNDYDVDYFVENDVGDNDEQYVSWGQVKFSESFDKVVQRHEMETFGKTLTYLEDCPETANERFKEHSRTFNRLGGRDAKIRKKMTFIVAGTLNEQTKNLLESRDWQRTIENLRGPKTEFRCITIDEILDDIIRPKTDTLKIKLDGVPLIRDDNVTKKKSIIGFVKAIELVNIVDKYPGMFGLNVRESLGDDTPTFKGMSKTLLDPILKKQFWKFNNGVTATCKSFEKLGINPPEFQIKDFKVVNGRQTTYCLNENNKKDPAIIDNDVFVGIIIHETESPEEINEITRSTNTQNPVKPVDLISNFDEVNNLAIQCRHKFFDFYFERQTKGFDASSDETKKRVTKHRLLDKNKTARAYIAYSTAFPNDAMISDRVLFSTVNPTYYESIFKGRDIKDLIIPHIFMQILNGLDSFWGKEVRNGNNTHKRDKEIIHKEIVRYFLLDLLGQTMNELSSIEKNQVERSIIEIIKKLKTKDKMPSEFLSIAEKCYEFFMFFFDLNSSKTWPDELNSKLTAPGYVPNSFDKPTGFDVMRILKLKGPAIREVLKYTRTSLLNQGNIDPVKEVLLSISTINSND